MADPVIRPDNGLLLFGLQTAEGSPLTLDPALHAIAIVEGSFTYTSPFTTEDSNESNGSFEASAPLVIGQEVKLSFRMIMKGAGAGVTYTGSVKPPLHAPLGACGWRGFFQASVAASALTAGSGTTGTLGTGYTGTAQLYRGMPLILSVGPGNGHIPLITDFTAGKVATLSDTFSPVLTTSTLAAIPANWTYAPTTPIDAAGRLTDHPCASVSWFEDGNLHQWQDVRGTVEFEGKSARPGEAVFNMTGTYMGASVAAMPTNAVVASQSGPLLVKGANTPPAAIINRIQLPISTWAMRSGASLDSIDDPNTLYGFGPGQIAGRKTMFEADPLRTLVSTRDAIAEIEAALNYPIALRAGATVGNRWALVHPTAQPVAADPGMRSKMRSDQMKWQGLSPGRDAQGRDSGVFLSFF
jgi:hypothetical protein